MRPAEHGDAIALCAARRTAGGAGEHVLDVDVAEVLADPTTSDLDPGGAAGRFLMELSLFLPGDGHDAPAPVVVVRGVRREPRARPA